MTKASANFTDHYSPTGPSHGDCESVGPVCCTALAGPVAPVAPVYPASPVEPEVIKQLSVIIDRESRTKQQILNSKHS